MGRFDVRRRAILALAFAGPAAVVATAAAGGSPYRGQAIGPTVTQPGAYNDIEPVAINDAGQVLGYAATYGSASVDSGVWLHSPRTGTFQLLGLTDAGHTGPGGSGANGAGLLNATGTVVGTAGRYAGTASLGYDAWAYDPGAGTTRVIGLADDAHTAADGTRTNTPVALNASGLVAGITVKTNTGYNRTTYDAWLYSPATGTTQPIGLSDAAHAPTAGGSNNGVVALNATGQVLGTAARVDGRYGPYADGTDAWVYSAKTATYRTVGVVDADHRGFYGPVNDPVALNAAGQVIGTSDRTLGGDDAWVDLNNGNPAHLIGLTDAAHAVKDARWDTPVALNAAGRVAGWSERYRADGNDANGRDAWTYSPTDDRTSLIGLTDAAHTSPTGSDYNQPLAINAGGDILGTARNYAGGGTDAWLFDPTTGLTTPLDLPDGSPGYLAGLTDAGQVAGTYLTTDGNGNDTAHGFIWSAADGFQPLDTPDGFATTDQLLLQNAAGQIAATGDPTNAPGSRTSFLLTPAVPEPTAVALALAAAPLILARRRRTTATA